MPFNGSGTFSIINTFVPNTTILSAAVNQNFTDIATGLSDCLTRDGQAGMTAALGLIAGTSAAPSLKSNSDAKSGLYFPAVGSVALVADALGLKVNGQTYGAISAAVQSGGSGYAVGDTIYETGGTFATPAVFTVATLSGSAVATVTMTVPGIYTVRPTNPVSQGSTSGAGTGCTLNITFNDLSAPVYNLGITDLLDALIWTKFGASSFVSGLMAKANGLDFATGIGSANLVQVISGSFILPPAGRLSLVSGTPVPNTDQTGKTRLYWGPYQGNGTPIYNGVAFINTTSAEIFADLTAGAQASGGIYDVYKFLNAGVVTLGFSPTWSAGTSGSVSLGSSARGTGTGGTALTYINGIPTNAVAMTVNNGATTYSVAINQGTYLGSVYVNSTAGQLNCHITYGQSRVWDVWNAFNRVPIQLLVGDSTSTWADSGSSAWRASNANTANKFTSFCGLAEEQLYASFWQTVTISGSLRGVALGIGTNWVSGTPGNYIGEVTQMPNTANISVTANASLAPTLGINNFTCLESAVVQPLTFNGGAGNMIMNGIWRG